MDDKNELNDLLLGNQKESSSSKKFFLIAAGILLLFFIIIGIMKFMGSSDTKQPLPITAADQMKKIPEPAMQQPAMQNNNATAAPADSNASATADEKLNAIVKKLQQDAQSQATSAPVANVAQPAANAPVQVPVATKQQAQQHQATQQAAPKTTVVTVPIKTASVAPQPVVKAVKEEPKKEDVKKAFKEATKNVTKTTAKAEAKPKATQADTKPKTATTATAGTYYVQVGYFESEAAAKGLREKANSAGFGSTTKAAVKNDKNITKVWVGPFDSKEDAAKALPKIREQVKSDAFIIKG